MKTRDLVGVVTEDNQREWRAAMARYQSLPMPERMEVRRAVTDRAIERYQPGEMGSSDFNHYLVGFIRSGEYDEILQELGIHESLLTEVETVDSPDESHEVQIARKIARHATGIEARDSDSNWNVLMIRMLARELLAIHGITENVNVGTPVVKPTKANLAAVTRNTAQFGPPFVLKVFDFPGVGDLSFPVQDLTNARLMGKRYAKNVELYL